MGCMTAKSATAVFPIMYKSAVNWLTSFREAYFLSYMQTSTSNKVDRKDITETESVAESDFTMTE